MWKAIGDFIAKYELVSGLGAVVILGALGFIARHLRRRPVASAPPRTELTQKRYEVYDTLFKLIHEALGRVTHLYGARQEPDFDVYSLTELDQFMTDSRFPQKTKAAILGA